MARAPNGHQNGDDEPEHTSDGYVQVPQRHTYNIRCGHIDYHRPPRQDDRGEAHWRCPAWFVFDPYAEQDWQRLYCAHHRHDYVPLEPSGPPSSNLDVVTRVLHEMPAASGSGDGLTTEERAWATARKQELRRHAIEAGVLAREPGGDDA
jgi:hypothetical protein